MTDTLAPVKPARLIINGEAVDAASGRTFTTVNPATEEPLCAVAEAGAEDVDRAVREHGRQPPVVTDETMDTPVEALTMTLHSWYESNEEGETKPALHHVIDQHLRLIFPNTEGLPAVEILQTHRKDLLRDVYQWTGVDRDVLGSLYRELQARVRFLELKSDPTQTAARLAGVAGGFKRHYKPHTIGYSPGGDCLGG